MVGVLITNCYFTVCLERNFSALKRKLNQCFHGDWRTRLSTCGLRNESAAGFLLWNQAGWKFKPVIYFREKLDGCKQAESPDYGEVTRSLVKEENTAAGDLFLHHDFIIALLRLRCASLVSLRHPCFISLVLQNHSWLIRTFSNFPNVFL